MMNYLSVAIPGASFTHSLYKFPSAELSDKYIHDNYEIFFIVSGKGNLTVEAESYNISHGALFAIPPMKYHSLDLSLDTPYEFYSLRFSAGALIQEVSDLLTQVFASDNCKRYSFMTDSDGVFSVFERFQSLTTMNQTEKNLYFKILISELLLLLSVNKEDELNNIDRDLGSRVIRYLSENIDADISLDTLARRFFVSKYYLCRAFKKRNGISPHDYINRKRVMFAKQLIDEGESASAAAYKVGFGDYSAFYRAYVKYFGSSPMTKERIESLESEGNC